MRKNAILVLILLVSIVYFICIILYNIDDYLYFISAEFFIRLREYGCIKLALLLSYVLSIFLVPLIILYDKMDN